ncbi:MAG: ATP-binding cassette domain-containing protein [Alphaproteobacteria bacterium]
MPIVLKNISYASGGELILENVSFSLQEKSLTTLLGPNGAGKTTLLKILLGLLKPSAGSIHHPPDLRIGYMPQKISLNPFLPLTVNRFLKLTPNTLLTSLEALEKVAADYLCFKPLLNLSGGELQKVLLAKALMRSPQLLILDEPTQGLDLQGQAHFYEVLLAIRQEKGCSILLVSHDLHTVLEASDHVICLNRHICCEGSPEAVQQAPAYLHLFPGFSLKPKHRFYAHRHDHTHLPSAKNGNILHD